jgi:phosphatidylglycerol:prolipoprotein diacylglycerol transferase
LYPKLIEIGDFYLPTYGVLVALGFLAGLAATVKLAKRAGFNSEIITNLAVYVALSDMLGAKLFMIAFDWRDYAAAPGRIFSFETLQAAGVFQGGLILALITAFFYMRQQGLPVLGTADIFAPGVAIGHAVGRLGCFAAGCCWGVECDLPWAVTFHDPVAFGLTGVPLEVGLHPTQLYESVAEFALFAFLFALCRKPHVPGRVIGLYLVLSSAMRFGIEFLRFHQQPVNYGLSLTQWISIALALAGIVLLARTGSGKPTPSTQLAQV